MSAPAVSWAKPRQVVIAPTDHDADTAAVRKAPGPGEGFTYPELAKISLTDATLPISAGRYLELVGSSEGEGPVGRWLSKIGGRGGFVLTVQHPDPDGVRTRAKTLGVRVPVDEMAFGRTVLQLHPKDVGLVLEVDGIADPDEWFWDDIDPAAMNSLWHRLLDLGESALVDQVDVGGCYVKVTVGGPSADWTLVLRTRSTAAVDPGLTGISFWLI